MQLDEKEKREWVRDRKIKNRSRRENWVTESRVAKSDNGEVMAVTVRGLWYIANDDVNDPLSRRRSLSGFPCARVSSAWILLPGTFRMGKRLSERSSRSGEFSRPASCSDRWMELVCRCNHPEVVNIVATKLIKKFRAKYTRWTQNGNTRRSIAAVCFFQSFRSRSTFN